MADLSRRDVEVREGWAVGKSFTSAGVCQRTNSHPYVRIRNYPSSTTTTSRFRIHISIDANSVEIERATVQCLELTCLSVLTNSHLSRDDLRVFLDVC